MMLSEICAEIKNYFVAQEGDIHIGDFSIENGIITPSFDLPTDYIRIVDSRKNDGVHKRDENGNFVLEDEEMFHGGVWIMSPPNHFLALVDEIESWQQMYGAAGSQSMSPFSSESFGGYSYTKSSGSSRSDSNGSNLPSWKTQYASRLKIYRRIREL